jgi:hypothetical protein
MFCRAGLVVSTTLTVKLDAGEVLFDLSLAVQETVVLPSGNDSPEG